MMARVSGELTTVVLDTNVVVAALLWDGVPRALLELVAAEPWVVAAVSPELITELERVLQRPQLAERVRATGRTEELISRYREITATVTPVTVAPVVVADCDDDHVLALAVAAHASLVITGDRSHLFADWAARGDRDRDTSSSTRFSEATPMSGTQDIKAAVKKRPTTFQVTPGESRPNRLTDHLTPQCTACGRRVAGNQSQAWHLPGFGRNMERGGRSANSTRNVW